MAKSTARNKTRAPSGRMRKVEKIKRRSDVEALMMMQVSAREIEAEICKKHDCAPRTVRRDIFDIYGDWAAEDAKTSKNRRHQLRMTIRGYMQQAAGDRKWNAVAKFVDQLMKLDGMSAPIQVDINTTATVEHRIAQMTSGEKRKRMGHWLGVIAERKAERDKELTN